jgi:hypothetical protein
LDLIIRWKASAMRTLGLGCFDAEAVRPSTQAGRVYRLCQRVERMRDEFARVDDARVRAILARDAERSEDDEAASAEPANRDDPGHNVVFKPFRVVEVNDS